MFSSKKKLIMPAYNAALEAFSKPLLKRADYVMGKNYELTLRNGGELLPFWRYPDLTAQTEYLHTVLEHAISSIPSEVELLRRHDATRAAIGGIVDLPGPKLNLLINLLRKNSWRLSQGKRHLFAELSDDEIKRIESAASEIHGAPLEEALEALRGKA